MQINATGGIINQIVMSTTGKCIPSPPGIFCSKYLYSVTTLTVHIAPITKEDVGICSLRNMQKFLHWNIWITVIIQGVECSQMNMATVQRYSFPCPEWIAENLQEIFDI